MDIERLDTHELLCHFADDFHDWIDGDYWPETWKMEGNTIVVTFTDMDEESPYNEPGRVARRKTFRVTVEEVE